MKEVLPVRFSDLMEQPSAQQAVRDSGWTGQRALDQAAQFPHFILWCRCRGSDVRHRARNTKAGANRLSR
jgi:hypothetical protein